MNNKKIQTVSFFGLLLLFLILAVLLFWPFYKLIALAVILAVLFLPLYKFLLKKLKSENIAAILTVLVILAIIVIPIYFISQAAIKELMTFYDKYRQGSIEVDFQALTNYLPNTWHETIEGFMATISESINSWTHGLVLNFVGLVSDITGFLLSFFLLFFIIFFVLKDHKKLRDYFEDLLILPRKREDFLIKKLKDSINGVIKGDFLIALLQGVTAAIGFVMTGVPEPILWTLATILSSFIPIVGTGLVIVPAVLYLLFFKSFISAAILTVWYIVVHLMVDNIIGPKLIGQQTRIHPLLVLLSILGGLEVFGALGFLYGPIILAIFIALMDIYRTDNK